MATLAAARVRRGGSGHIAPIPVGGMHTQDLVHGGLGFGRLRENSGPLSPESVLYVGWLPGDSGVGSVGPKWDSVKGQPFVERTPEPSEPNSARARERAFPQNPTSTRTTPTVPARENAAGSTRVARPELPRPTIGRMAGCARASVSIKPLSPAATDPPNAPRAAAPEGARARSSRCASTAASLINPRARTCAWCTRPTERHRRGEDARLGGDAACPQGASRARHGRRCPRRRGTPAPLPARPRRPRR